MSEETEQRSAQPPIKAYPAFIPRTRPVSAPKAVVKIFLIRSTIAPTKKFPITLPIPMMVTVKEMAVSLSLGYRFASSAITVG